MALDKDTSIKAISDKVLNEFLEKTAIKMIFCKNYTLKNISILYISI